MHRAVVVGANGEGSADALAVDDDGCFGGRAGRGWFDIGVVDYGFDLSDVSKLDGSGPLLFLIAPTILDLHEVWTACNLAVDMRLDLVVIARGI